jgi:hypothetical protein
MSILTLIINKSVTEMRGSSICIATGYGLDDRGSEVRFPAGLGISLFSTMSRSALGPSRILYNGYQVISPGGKAAGA